MKYKSLLISSEDLTWQLSALNVLIHLVLFSVILFSLNLKFGSHVQSRALAVGMTHYYLKSFLFFALISWFILLCFCHASSGTDWTLKFDWRDCDVDGKNRTGVFEWDGVVQSRLRSRRARQCGKSR